MRLLCLFVLASACGRVNFDPLFDSGGTTGDGGSGSGADGGGGLHVCMGGNPSCTATAGSLNVGGSYQAGNDTRTLGNGLSGSCGGANANEFTIQLIAFQAGTFQFSTAGSTFDTVFYIRDDCNGAELLCEDVPNGTEVVTLAMTQGQRIVAVVDGADECGIFQLRAIGL